MKFKEFLNKRISYESMEKFMDRMDTFLWYAVSIIGLILVVVHLIR